MSVKATFKKLSNDSGHVISAFAQPIVMFAPSKVAAVWFPDNQRAIANTLATGSNPLGILAANVFSPLLVKNPEDVQQMLIIYACPAGEYWQAVFLSLFCRSLVHCAFSFCENSSQIANQYVKFVTLCYVWCIL